VYIEEFKIQENLSCWCLGSNDEPESSTRLDDKASGKKMKGKKQNKTKQQQPKINAM